ncbi:MAG: hypothetical protein OXD46_09035 [Chloroflexi bacterium]|nr:hypothetical protein [Chloroflexota bacterium]
MERLTRRMEALETAQISEDAAGDEEGDAPDSEGRDLRLSG